MQAGRAFEWPDINHSHDSCRELRPVVSGLPTRGEWGHGWNVDEGVFCVSCSLKSVGVVHPGDRRRARSCRIASCSLPMRPRERA